MKRTSALFIVCFPALRLLSAETQSVEPPASHAQEVARAAEALRPKLIATRRDLHMHPELSNQEERTARVVAERLRALGLDEIKTNLAGHGVVALLKGAKPGPVVALRADMDALPINETLDVPYKSLTPGVKHACGHDAHTTVGLGVAELLSRMRGQIQGSVKFVFQPAEEIGDAERLINASALENPRPLAVFGLHCTPELEAGQMGYRSGAAQASADDFTITIRGKMAHGASPHKGIDAIVVAAECVTALQSIRSRRLDTFEPLVLTIGSIHGGNRANILAEEVTMIGTVRAFSDELRVQVEQMMRETIAGVTAAHGAKFDFDYQRGTMVVYNDPKLVEESLPTIRRTVGETNVFEVPRRMGAEDFCFYRKAAPTFFLRLGSSNKAKGITAEGHTPEFDIDEECLVVGVKVMSNLALDFLDRHCR